MLNNQLFRKLSYLAVAASLIGADIIALDLKIFQFSLYRIILFCLFLVLVTEFFKKRELKPFSSNNRFSIIFMLIWVAYATLSLLWVNDNINWMKAVFFIGVGLLCIMIFMAFFKKMEHVLAAMKVISFMVFFHSVISLIELITDKYWFLRPDYLWKYLSMNYPVSMFSTANDLAIFLMMTIPVLYICFVNTQKLWEKMFYVITGILSLIVLWATQSRACYLGLLIAIMVFIALKYRKEIYNFYFKKLSRTWRIAINVSLVICVAASIVFLFMAGIISQQLHLIFDFNPENIIIGESDPIRINLIKNGFIFLKETFGFGVGAGNIEYWMANRGIFYTVGIVNIHNWWLEILVAYGLPIFILYLMFFTRLMKDLYSSFKSAASKLEESISIGLFSSMAGFVVASIGPSTNINKEWLWMFWALVITYQGLINQKKMPIASSKEHKADNLEDIGKVSIIVPVYNVEKYLSKCLDSLMRQTYKNIELILVDDGSNDGSNQICSRYAENDSRIKLIVQENKGVSSARNTGLNIASGEYIIFVDSDDWVESEYVEFLVEKIRESKADLVVCGYYNDLLNGTVKQLNVDKLEILMDSQEALIKCFEVKSDMRLMCNKIFRRNIIDENKIRFNEDFTIGEDFHLIFRYIMNSKVVVYNPKPLYHYLQRTDSAMIGEFKESKLSRVKAYEDMLETSRDKYPALAAYIKAGIVLSCIKLSLEALRTDKINNKLLQSLRLKIVKYLKGYLLMDSAYAPYKTYAILIAVNPIFFINIWKKTRKLLKK